jgi:heterodisulfide reductase subunit A
MRSYSLTEENLYVVGQSLPRGAIEVENESEIKIGVFICNCGTKIADVIDVEELAKGVSEMPNVALVQRELYSCSKKGLRQVKETIGEHGLNRIVVAGCTPRTHEPLFKAALEEAGLNGSLFEMVNIREQCALVHADDEAAATKKASDLIRMGVAKAALLEAKERIETRVTPAALVIGGGVAGLTAALAVAKGGFPVKLVEKEARLGGLVGKLHSLYPHGESAREFIEKRIEAVKEHPAIEIFTGADVSGVSGSVGDYHIAIEQNGLGSEFDVGAIIVASGAQELEPDGLFRHDGVKVITQLELEEALHEDSALPHQVVMILDGVDKTYHSSISGATALKNAILLKRRDPDMDLSLLFRHLGADLDQRKIEEAKDLGVDFVRYDGQRRPWVTEEVVEVYDQLREEELAMPYDLVVLAMPLVSQDDAAKISTILRIPLDQNGFFLEPNIRLRPQNYVPEGIFVCGSAHYPADVNESIFQAYRAAARTLRYLAEGKVGSETASAIVIESLCTGCGTCVEACPFQAIAMEEREGTLSVSKIDPMLCKRCGNCTVVCPVKAIAMEPYTDRELIAQINAALAAPRDGEPRVLGLFCEWSGYAAADLAGAEGLQYPHNLRIIRLGCSARFDPYHILWAFLNGADGILLGACDPGMCHYVEGNQYAEERIEMLQRMLKEAGFDPRRLKLRWFKPDDAEKFVEAVKEFTDEIEYLDPTDLG